MKWRCLRTADDFGQPRRDARRRVGAFGDFRRIHRTGLIACVQRASEWRHKAIEIAAHDLLQELDQEGRLTSRFSAEDIAVGHQRRYHRRPVGSCAFPGTA